jgi:hypothetical protein
MIGCVSKEKPGLRTGQAAGNSGKREDLKAHSCLNQNVKVMAQGNLKYRSL